MAVFKHERTGVGTGEFARLVPRDPTPGGSGNTSSHVEIRKEIEENKPTTALKTRGAATTKDRSCVEGGAGAGEGACGSVQQQLLEDLVPPAAKTSLPGTGIKFVDSVESEEAGGVVDVGGDGTKGIAGASGGGSGAMSVFERNALQKARARQKDRMEAGEPQVSLTCATFYYSTIIAFCSILVSYCLVTLQ